MWYGVTRACSGSRQLRNTQQIVLLYQHLTWWPVPIRHLKEGDGLGWHMWLGYHWWLPIQLQATGLMHLNFVNQDHRRTTTHATTLRTEAGTQFTDPEGMEGRVIHESALAGS